MSDTNPPPILLVAPSHWTTAQADAVIELLSQLADAVFLAYERPLIERARREALGLPSSDEDEAAYPPDPTPDPIPF